MGLDDNLWKFHDSVCTEITWQSYGNKVILMYVCGFSSIQKDKPRIYFLSKCITGGREHLHF